MTYPQTICRIIMAVMLVAPGIAKAQITIPPPMPKHPSMSTPPDVSRVALLKIKEQHRGQYAYPEGFQSGFVVSDGIRMHYVAGGEGPPIVFVHGFGSTWKMWEPSLEFFGKSHRVVALDMPGLGQSEPSRKGYDAVTISQYLFLAIQQLTNGPVVYVCHDLCNSVSYPLVAMHQGYIRRAVFMESPIPDKAMWTYPGLSEKGPGLGWHFGFFAFGDIAEKLIGDDPKLFMSYFINTYAGKPDFFNDTQMDELVEPYSTAEILHAAFSGYYSAHNQDIAENEELLAQGRQLTVPVMSASGALGVGTVLPSQLLGRFIAPATDVSITVIPDCGHWMLEQCPSQTNKALEAFINAPAHH